MEEIRIRIPFQAQKMEPFTIFLVVILSLILVVPVMRGLFALCLFMAAGFLAAWAGIAHFFSKKKR